MRQTRFFRFLRLCVSKAWSTSWGKADALSSAGGIVAGAVVHYVPGWERTVNSLLWEMPIAALAMVALSRLALSPYWLYQDKEKEALDKQSTIDRLSWPDNRPFITFDKWDICSDTLDDPRRGFFVTNHGGTALAIMVEPFEVLGTRWMAREIQTIQGGQSVCALIWCEGIYPRDPAKWDLLAAFRPVEPSGMHQTDRTIPVSAIYRDINNIWYRSRAKMVYAAYGAIMFEATTQEPLGFREEQNGATKIQLDAGSKHGL